MTIGSFNLYTYGLFVALGFFTAMQVSKINAKPHDISAETITDIFFVIFASALVGSRLLYVLINFSEYKNNLIGIFQIWNGGLVFFGGFVAVCAACLIYFKKKNLPILKTADIISPGIAVGHAIGRIGCLFAGCCYGKVCEWPIAIKFTNSDSLAPLHVFLHPTQIYSIISNLAVFLALLWLQKRKKKFDGRVFLIYIILYSLLRSIIEFFRGDFRGDFIFDFISMSQGIGFMVSLTAFVLLIKLSKSSNDSSSNS